MSTLPVHDTKQQKFALISKQKETLEEAIRSHEREIQACKKSLLDLDSHWNTVTDVGRLPDKILIDIWSFFSDFSGDSSDQLFEWLGITHVCSRWRELALNTPSLWRSPYLMIPDIAKIFIERAGNGPFNIFLDLTYIDALEIDGEYNDDSNDASEILTFACSLFHQIRSLTIEAADTMCSNGFYSSENFLHSIEKYGTFPLLNEISLSYDEPPSLTIAEGELDVDGLILSAPALQRLYLGNRCMFTFPLKIAPKTLPITFLELDLDPNASNNVASHQIHLHEMMQILGMLPCIRTLYLTNPFKPICERDEEWARTHTDPIFLARLLSLYLKIPIEEIEFFLTHVHFPITARVDIQPSDLLSDGPGEEQEALQALLTASSKIKDLGKLVTHLTISDDSDLQSSDEMRPEVILAFFRSERSEPSLSVTWPLDWQPSFSCVPSIYGLQNLKTLSYCIDYSDRETWKAFGCLPALSELRSLDPDKHLTIIKVLSIFRDSGDTIFQPTLLSTNDEDASQAMDVAGAPLLYFPKLILVDLAPCYGHLALMEELNRIMAARFSLSPSHSAGNVGFKKPGWQNSSLMDYHTSR